jgi:hypothetical protein
MPIDQGLMIRAASDFVGSVSAKDRSNQNRDLSLARKNARVPQSQGLWGLRPEPATEQRYLQSFLDVEGVIDGAWVKKKFCTWTTLALNPTVTTPLHSPEDIRRRAMRQRRPGRIAKGAQRNAGLGARHRRAAVQTAEFRREFGFRRWRRAAGPRKSRR